MGEVRFFRAVQGGREWLFAYLDGPDAVWGMDRLSGEEWWYEPSLTGWLAPIIRSRLASGVPIPEAGSAGSGPATAVPAVAQRYDLALHEPGHAVLAALHARLGPGGAASGTAALTPDQAALARAYVGEVDVSAALDRLSSRWRVLHSVPAGDAGTGVDHVIIGPAGVFTIMSRNHTGVHVTVAGDTVVAAGRQESYIPDARLGAQQAQTALSADVALASAVFPTVAIVGASLQVSQSPDYVSVLDATGIVDWLSALPPRLAQAQVVAAYDVLRWSDAWTPSAPPPTAPESTRLLALAHGRLTPGQPVAPAVVAPTGRRQAPAPGAVPVQLPPPGVAAEPAPAAGRRSRPERSRATTGPSDVRRARPEAPTGARFLTPRAKTVLAIVSSVMLFLLIAPSIIVGVQRAMSEPDAAATETPTASPVEPVVGGPCTPPDEVKPATGDVLACNLVNSRWAIRGTVADLGKPCKPVDTLGWDRSRDVPLICAKVGTKLEWKQRKG